MNWLILFIAGCFEICWAIGLKYSNGFTNIKWAVFTVVTLALSMGLLAYCFKSLPVGTAYAVWTGIGAVGTALLGMYLFNESREVVRLFCIFLIVTGIIGLRVFAK